MCTGIEIAMMVASTVATVAGSVMQANAQKRAAFNQAVLLEQDARTEEAYSRAKADKIRLAGRYKSGEARADLARSGVSVAEGTPVTIAETIQSRNEEDALMEILTGTNKARSLRGQAAVGMAAAKDRANASRISAASTVLGAAGKVASGGWGGIASGGAGGDYWQIGSGDTAFA